MGADSGGSAGCADGEDSGRGEERGYASDAVPVAALGCEAFEGRCGGWRGVTPIPFTLRQVFERFGLGLDFRWRGLLTIVGIAWRGRLLAGGLCQGRLMDLGWETAMI